MSDTAAEDDFAGRPKLVEQSMQTDVDKILSDAFTDMANQNVNICGNFITLRQLILIIQKRNYPKIPQFQQN